MDIKISGVSDEVMAQALAQAKAARLADSGRDPGGAAGAARGPERLRAAHDHIKIDPEKIGAVIGPGGKVVRGIQERTGVKIDIQDDGTIFIAGSDGPMVAKAIDEVQGLTESPEVGRVYTGKVTRIEPYGVFVEFLPGRDGLVHISQLADHRVDKPEDEVSMGDEIMVMVTDAPVGWQGAPEPSGGAGRLDSRRSAGERSSSTGWRWGSARRWGSSWRRRGSSSLKQT